MRIASLPRHLRGGQGGDRAGGRYSRRPRCNERNTRIIVTAPSEAAESPTSAGAILRAGAECLWINAADYVRAQIGGADRRRLRNAVESISLGREDLTSLPPDIQVPSLFVTGADHTGFTPEQAREAVALVRGAQLATVPDAAYLAPLEQPDETARIVWTFWAATRG